MKNETLGNRAETCFILDKFYLKHKLYLKQKLSLKKALSEEKFYLIQNYL